MTSASTYSEQEPGSGQDAQADALPAQDAQLQSETQPLPEQQPPRLEDDYILHGRRPGVDDVTIFLSQLALKQVATHSQSDVHREVGGALLGHAYHYDGGLYVDVRAAIPAVTADHGPMHFTFTADAWSQLHKDRTQRYPDLDFVGWFHTHPDLGVFYSSDDVVVHSAAFTMPWHIGMVVDPLRRESSFFSWQGDTLVSNPGFYERQELQPASLLPWRIVPAEIWDHPYEYAEHGQSRRSAVYLAANAPPALPALTTYAGYGLAALGLLASLLLLLGWVVPLTREVDRLQNMVIVLADSALADGNAALCPDPRLRILSPLVGQSLPLGADVELMGTVMLPEVTRYQVDARPVAADRSWVTIGTVRGSTKLGELATWQTENWLPGLYELRLLAVDNNNIALPGAPDCSLEVELAP